MLASSPSCSATASLLPIALARGERDDQGAEAKSSSKAKGAAPRLAAVFFSFSQWRVAPPPRRGGEKFERQKHGERRKKKPRHFSPLESLLHLAVGPDTGETCSRGVVIVGREWGGRKREKREKMSILFFFRGGPNDRRGREEKKNNRAPAIQGAPPSRSRSAFQFFALFLSICTHRRSRW